MWQKVKEKLGGQTALVNQIYDRVANATFAIRKIASNGVRRPRTVVHDRQSTDVSASEPLEESMTFGPVAPPGTRCPICLGTAFEAFNGRALARCSTCRAVERNRLMWMILDRLGGFAAEKRVLHFAPELGLAQKFVELSGNGYHAADVDPDRYKSKFVNVRKIDLCSDLNVIPDASYDLILHSHVLEHIPCDVEHVLQELDRILAPNGLHFLCVPIGGERTDEDFLSELTDAERLSRFGQEDHMRIFGSRDIQELLAKVWGPGPHLVEPTSLFVEDDLRRALIPTLAWKGVSGHSIFHYRKGGRPPALEFSRSDSKTP